MTQVLISHSIVSVNPDRVESIKVDDSENKLLMTMIGGETHLINCRYGMSIWSTHAAVVRELNGGGGA